MSEPSFMGQLNQQQPPQFDQETSFQMNTESDTIEEIKEVVPIEQIEPEPTLLTAPIQARGRVGRRPVQDYVG